MENKKKAASGSSGVAANVNEVHGIIVPKGNGIVKREILKKSLEKAPAKDLVTAVQTVYPKYDKTLQSKVTSGEYGIEWTDKAAQAVAELVLNGAQKKKDTHRYSKRISARLPDKMHARLLRVIGERGFESVQSWLIYIVTDYLRKDMER